MLSHTFAAPLFKPFLEPRMTLKTTYEQRTKLCSSLALTPIIWTWMSKQHISWNCILLYFNENTVSQPHVWELYREGAMSFFYSQSRASYLKNYLWTKHTSKGLKTGNVFINFFFPVKCKSKFDKTNFKAALTSSSLISLRFLQPAPKIRL